MNKLIEICKKYNNVSKNEMKKLNLKKYTKNDFLNFNKHNNQALHHCCKNNNLLGPKYFVKRFSITKDEIMNPDKCYHVHFYYAFSCKHLSLIEYLINTFNLTKNDLMKLDYWGSSCLNYLFTSHYNTKFLHKICLYIFNKYNFTKNDICYGNDLLSLCCFNKLYKLLKYLIIKYKFTESDLKYLNRFNNDIQIKKIVLINNLLNCNNYNKLFDLIYKKN